MYERIVYTCRLTTLIATVGLIVFYTHRWHADPMLEELLLAGCQTFATLGVGTHLIVTLLGRRIDTAVDTIDTRVATRIASLAGDLLDLQASADTERRNADRLDQMRPPAPTPRGRRLVPVED